VAETSFDSLTPGAGRQLAQDGAGTRQIKSEIERTRIEMRETIDEIQDRLRPDHLLEEARGRVTGAAAGKVRNIMSSASEKASEMATRARGAGNYMADYATDHPIRIAIAVGAMTWWALRGRGSSYTEFYGDADTNWDEADAMAPGVNRSLRDKVGEYASTARETVGEYASTARETVGEYATSARQAVGEYAGSARESARSAAARAGSAARSAATSANDWVTDNPMAAGAIALAVGAAIGLSVRRTEFENTTMGQARDRAWQRGKQVAENLKVNVGEKVATATENIVGESIKQAATTPPSEPIGRV
jgi:ElaB/YqjD/DUF883 family membrane-anchored ribosome-binding protein